MSDKTNIYTLSDPNTGLVRYVGKSDDVKVRFQSHVREAIACSETHKSKWIRKLHKDGKLPVLSIIDTINKNDWKQAEIYYIDWYRTNGFNLTNTADGGEGFNSGYKQDLWFLFKKNFGKWYGQAKREQNYKRMNSCARVMNQFYKQVPNIVPKNWKYIQLP